MNSDVLKKREKFFNDNPDIYRLYNEVKSINEKKDGQNEEGYRKIKEYAILNTKFYSKYSVNDTFPVMTKMDFISNYDDIRSSEVFDKPLHISSTSGSTGIPFSVEQDYMKRMRNIADLKVFGDYADYPSHEKMLQLRAYNGKKLDREVDERENIWRYDISNLSNTDIEDLIKFIIDWEPRIIFGYTSTMEVISDYILNNGLKIDFKVNSILVGAETLTDEIANKIKSVFRCPIYDRYSNMEMGIYSQRKYGETNFRINKASYYLEVLKIDSDEPADEGEVGRIVFTDLYNHRFPMIRYDTGDLGVYCYNESEIELKEVYGRMRDCVYSTNGMLLSPAKISVAMWGCEKIKQWQFIQEDKCKYILKLNCNDVIKEDVLCQRFKDILGDDADIVIEMVEDIPVLSSSKRRAIICNYKINK